MRLDAAGMNRALLRRLSAARWVIVCAVLLVAAAGAAAWRAMEMLSVAGAPLLDRGAYQAEEREIRFWLAALRRMEAEQQQQPGGTPMVSLQVEQAAVLGRLREIAERMPPEHVPVEIGALLDRAAMAPRQPAAATPADVPPPVAPAPINLRVGLTSRAEMPDFSSLAVPASSLLPIIVERRPAPHRAASATSDEKRSPKDRDEKPEKPPAR